jgi:amino acid transporter
MNVSLKKILKLRTVISTAAGMAMATSCYLAGLQIAVIVAGELAWISILIAGLLCLLSAMCFSELTSLYPSAAGIKLFMENAFNEKASIAIGMFYVILGASMVGAESYLLSSVLIDSVGIMINISADRFFWQIIFILAVGYINYRGIRITGWTQDVMTYLMFGFLIFVSVYTLSVKDINYTTALTSPDFTVVKVFSAAAVGVFMYVGFEWVAPLAEETADYRMIGKGMLYAVGLLSVTYSLFVVAMYSGLTQEQLKSGTTIPHILFARNIFGTTGGIMFILMSIIASVTSFNAGLLNTSRFTYAMARDNTLPRFFSRLHPDYATPWAAIVSLVAFAIILSFFILITGKYLFIIIMAAALECFIYVVIAVCVLILRKKYPDKNRSYKVPFGKTVPIITAIVFGGLMIGIFADSTKDYAGNILFENFWVAFAMAGFAFICILYAMLVVPKLKALAAERSSIRKKRRPGRSR